MKNIIDENKILKEIKNKVNNYVDNSMDKYINSHNTNYFLVYPLIAIEIGVINKEPENMDNLFLRCIAGFVYSNVIKRNVKMNSCKSNVLGIKKYIKETDGILYSMFQDFRFAREVGDTNSFSKAKLCYLKSNEYYLNTSWVYNNLDESMFYFYGLDNILSNEIEKKQTLILIKSFWDKILLCQTDIKVLENDTDMELYQFCCEIVDKDINKWLKNVRSDVFTHPKQLSGVIGYLYYRAMLKSVYIRIILEFEDDIYKIGKEVLLSMNKDDCIKEICRVASLNIYKVEKIINYLINDGSPNFMEFPLFEIDEYIVTVPSLIRVNDWQFNIINGHYIKKLIL